MLSLILPAKLLCNCYAGKVLIEFGWQAWALCGKILWSWKRAINLRMEMRMRLLIWLWPKPKEASCPRLRWMETFIKCECSAFEGVESSVWAHRILAFRGSLYRLKDNKAFWGEGPVTLPTVFSISQALVLTINNKICTALSLFGLLISGKNKFFLCSRCPDWLIYCWNVPTVVLFYKPECIFTRSRQPCVMCTSCSSTYVTGKTFFFNGPARYWVWPSCPWIQTVGGTW